MSRPCCNGILRALATKCLGFLGSCIPLRFRLQPSSREAYTAICGELNIATGQWIEFRQGIRTWDTNAVLKSVYDANNLAYTNHDLTVVKKHADIAAALHENDTHRYLADLVANTWTYSRTNNLQLGAAPFTSSGYLDWIDPALSWAYNLAFGWPYSIML